MGWCRISKSHHLCLSKAIRNERWIMKRHKSRNLTVCNIFVTLLRRFYVIILFREARPRCRSARLHPSHGHESPSSVDENVLYSLEGHITRFHSPEQSYHGQMLSQQVCNICHPSYESVSRRREHHESKSLLKWIDVLWPKPIRGEPAQSQPIWTNSTCVREQSER